MRTYVILALQQSNVLGDAGPGRAQALRTHSVAREAPSQPPAVTWCAAGHASDGHTAAAHLALRPAHTLQHAVAEVCLGDALIEAPILRPPRRRHAPARRTGWRLLPHGAFFVALRAWLWVARLDTAGEEAVCFPLPAWQPGAPSAASTEARGGRPQGDWGFLRRGCAAGLSSGG